MHTRASTLPIGNRCQAAFACQALRPDENGFNRIGGLLWRNLWRNASFSNTAGFQARWSAAALSVSGVLFSRQLISQSLQTFCLTSNNTAATSRKLHLSPPRGDGSALTLGWAHELSASTFGFQAS